jgi:hypothetical protein
MLIYCYLARALLKDGLNTKPLRRRYPAGHNFFLQFLFRELE